MEVAAEAPIDTGSDGDAAAQQATTKALSKFLSYDELKAHLAVNYAGLEASLLPNTTGSLLFAQKEAGEPIEDLFDSVPRDHKSRDRRQPAGELFPGNPAWLPRAESREGAYIYYAPDVQSL